MHSAVAIDHTSKRVQIMRGKRIWSNNEAAMEEEEDEEEKTLIEQKAQPTVALSHRNKSSAKRQLWEWAGLAALRQQFAENWTMLSAQHDCTLRARRRKQRREEEEDF